MVAWTVLTAIDRPTDDMSRCIDSCSDDHTMYSWRNSIIATTGDVPVGCLIAYDGGRYHELRQRTWPSLWTDLEPSAITQTADEAKAGEYYLDSMAILPEYRKLGIGKLLMEHAIAKGKESGCQCASLIVDCNKPRLKAYYESIGFEDSRCMMFFGHVFFKMTRSLCPCGV